jgi:membrane protein DedA with SNARE-associated domain
MHPVIQHAPSYIKALAPIIDQYGYLAVGGMLFLEDFGILVPGETVLLAAAFYAGFGQLNIFIVIIVGIVSAVLGDNVGFAIGNYGGHALVEKYGKYIFLSKKRFKRSEEFFNKYGGRVVVIARFVDGLRQINGIIAGISEMKWVKFLIFNVIGATMWVLFWSLVGYFGGNHINFFLHFELLFTIVLVLYVVSRMIYKHYKNKKVIDKL